MNQKFQKLKHWHDWDRIHHFQISLGAIMKRRIMDSLRFFFRIDSCFLIQPFLLGLISYWARHQFKNFIKQKRSNRRSSVSGVPRAGSNQSITESTSGLNKIGLNGNTTGSSNTINRYWRRPSLKRKPRISRSNSLQQVKTFGVTFRNDHRNGDISCRQISIFLSPREILLKNKL